jgi:hypothetical protein
MNKLFSLFVGFFTFFLFPVALIYIASVTAWEDVKLMILNRIYGGK